MIFIRCATKAVEILTTMSQPIELTDRESLIKSASTSLNSKVVSQQSSLLAPIAVDAVTKGIEFKHTREILLFIGGNLFPNTLLKTPLNKYENNLLFQFLMLN